MRRMLALGLVLFLCLTVMPAFSPSAQGSVIYIDFNTLEGAPSGPGGAVWNEFDPGDVALPTELVFTDGVSSGLFVQIDGLSGTTYNNVPSNTSLWPEPWDRGEVHDYIWLGAGQGTIKFSGLDASSTYAVEMLSQRAADGARLMTVTLNGAFSNGDVSEDFNTYTEGFVQQELLLWENVSADVNGEMTVLVDVPLPNFGYVNGMKITVMSAPDMIPEPATLTMLLLGGAALVRRMRKR